MIHIDQKITTWERFEIDDEHKDALLEYIKENPSFTSLDLYDWAHEQGYDPHSEIIEGAEETLDPYENNNKPTIVILQDDPDCRKFDNCMRTLWDNTPPSCLPAEETSSNK
jgi:hypothetical protein